MAAKRNYIANSNPAAAWSSLLVIFLCWVCFEKRGGWIVGVAKEHADTQKGAGERSGGKGVGGTVGARLSQRPS